MAEKVDFVESKIKSATSNEQTNNSTNSETTQAKNTEQYEPVQQQFEDMPYTDYDLPF